MTICIMHDHDYTRPDGTFHLDTYKEYRTITAIVDFTVVRARFIYTIGMKNFPASP